MVRDDKPTLLGFCDVVAVKKTWDHELTKVKVSTIKDPLYKYLHMLISSSITARGRAESGV
ncbi:hypothetical protein Hanom_Chr09g00776811 [Helianthus anomalus]